MGMLKSILSGETVVLLKVITGATDHSTGPVTKFDAEAIEKQRGNHGTSNRSHKGGAANYLDAGCVDFELAGHVLQQRQWTRDVDLLAGFIGVN